MKLYPFIIWVWAPYVEPRGTHYVTTVMAEDLEEAKVEAITRCHNDWGGCYEREDLKILGAAEGNTNLLEWNDNLEDQV